MGWCICTCSRCDDGGTSRGPRPIDDGDRGTVSSIHQRQDSQPEWTRVGGQVSSRPTEQMGGSVSERRNGSFSRRRQHLLQLPAHPPGLPRRWQNAGQGALRPHRPAMAPATHVALGRGGAASKLTRRQPRGPVSGKYSTCTPNLQPGLRTTTKCIHTRACACNHPESTEGQPPPRRWSGFTGSTPM
jgi:hypothetical protein